MSSTVEQIKERLSIVDVVSSYVKLEKAGVNFRARCPFHNERTPSFFVSPTRGSYHCFGCNRGGDIFTFIEEIEGATFKEALKTLADQAGVTLQYTPREDDGKEERLITLIEEATRFFQKRLVGEKGALSYLYNRGLKPETLKEFRVGLSPNAWDELSKALREKGYTDDEIVDAGLAIRNDSGGIYDRFRNRIMFPINNARGQVVAFSGRIYEDGKETPEKTAKYINTPETALFSKRKILYGYDSAKVAIRRSGNAIVVEGQTDFLMSRQAGFENTVAVSGTALTESHVLLLKRLADKVTLAFDNDEAGVQALTKTTYLTLREGIDTRAVMFDEDKDPAELIAQDPDKWQKLVTEAQPAVLVLTEIHKRAQKDLHTTRRVIGRNILPLLSVMENKIEQAHFLEEIARMLGLSEEPLREEMEKIPADELPEPDYKSEEDTSSGVSRLSIKERAARELLGFYFWQKSLSDPGIDTTSFAGRIEKALSEKPESMWQELSAEEQAEATFRAEHMYIDADKWETIAEELLTRAACEQVRSRYEDALNRLKEAEMNGKEEDVKKLLDECQKLSVELHLLQK